MKTALSLTAFISLLTAVACPASAGPVVPGFNSSSVGACDDCYTSSQAIGFDINFYGTTYSDLFVNNNGNVSFNYGMSNYTPYGIGSGYVGNPIIAPFFADVDTRGSGSGITAYGNGTYAGNQAFGVTWPSVGYFASQTDKLNTFQLILVNRSDVGTGDFDIYFNYNSIQWETGQASGGVDGLGGISAAAGFSNGTGDAGTYYQFPGSLVNGAFLDGGPYALATGTNDGTAGQYLFEVRNGQVIPPPGVPEPSTWAMMLVGFAGLGAAGYSASRRRSSLAV